MTTLMRGFPPVETNQVTLANWRLPPWNRWAFQHVRELVPSATITASKETSWQLEESPRHLNEVSFVDQDNQTRATGEFLTHNQTDGFLVLHRGRIVDERYDNGLTPGQPHILMSVSKSLTALLVGVLVEQGRVRPSAPVTDLVPEVSGSAFADCTVQHLLDMTVGVEFNEDYLATSGAIVDYRVASGWYPLAEGQPPTDLRSWLPSLHKSGKHGAQFHYVSPCSDLLGWVVERATDTRFSDLFAELVWRPMGAEHDAYVTVDRFGAPRTAGGICTTLGDLARVGQMVLDGGMANGRRILPADWIHDTRHNADRAAWLAQDPLLFLPDGGYRNKWWHTGNANGAFTGIGVYGQWLYVDPATEVVIAAFASQPLPVDDRIAVDTLSCFAAISESLASDA